MLAISKLGNQYFQSTMPWKLAKSTDPADKKRAATVVGEEIILFIQVIGYWFITLIVALFMLQT